MGSDKGILVKERSAGTIVVRPAPARLRRTAIAAVPGLALSGYGLVTITGDSGAWAGAAVAAALVAAVAGSGVFYLRQFRNERLSHRGWDLVHVDWRGRAQLIPHGDIESVHLVTVEVPGGGRKEERIIISRRSGHAAFMIRNGLWDVNDLQSLFGALGLGVRVHAQPVAPGRLAAHFPGVRLPFVERHPWLVASVAVVAIVVVVVAVLVATGQS
jgi:hypothetical protein